MYDNKMIKLVCKYAIHGGGWSRPATATTRGGASQQQQQQPQQVEEKTKGEQ
jgi:hypothetical protein